jgi:ABC-type Fe3+-siderophore transport system permease subunit
MTPWVVHGLCMVVVLLVARGSRQRVAEAVAASGGTLEAFGYAAGARWLTIACTAAMGVLLWVAEQMQEAQNPDDESAIPFIIALGFNAALFVVLDRRLLIGDDWASCGLSLRQPRRIPFAAFRGARVTSTPFFGGITTFHTSAGRLRVLHQFEQHKALIQRLRRLT